MPHKSGLGKGLDALIPSGNEFSQTSGLIEIPVEHIAPNPHQPRVRIDPQALQELASSIQEHGLLQPIVVKRKNEQSYTVITGERRWRAARQAGIPTIPAIVREASEQEQLELALIENVQRADLSPLETASAYRHLADDFHLTQDEIADRVGKSRVSISNTLRLLKLPNAVQAALAEETISEGHARALLGLNNTHAQLAVLQIIIKKGLNVRQTEELVRKLSGERPVRKQKPAVDPEIRDIEERLRIYLGTKVTLNHSRKGGSLVIRYYSNEELENIIAQILHR
jgi:ParB family chromosome partitioning protein